MLRVVASQQSPLKSKLQPRRPGLLRRAPRDERQRAAQAVPPDTGEPIPSLHTPGEPPPGRLRLVEEGEGEARQERRTTMETTEAVVRLPFLAGAGRVFSAARSAFALLGFAVALAAV